MSATLSATAGKRTLSLAEMAAELDRQQRSKIDVVADTRRMQMVTSGSGADDGGRSLLVIDAPGDELYEPAVNDLAHAQIADRLSIPKRYYDRLRAEAPALLDRNVNYWLAAKPEKRLVRILDGNARAFLSDRYRRLDHYDLMEHVLPVFGEIHGLMFQTSALTDRRLYVRALLPRLSAEIRVGDIVQAGVSLRNSEVGEGALVVEPFLWRLVCSNGMTTPIGRLRKYHAGRAAEEDDEQIRIYRDETLAADDAAFFLKVGDLVRAALSEAQFEEIVERMRGAAETRKIDDVPEATRVLSQRYDLTETEGRSILRHIIEGGDLTKWGAINAITAAAKDADSFDRQAEMEEIGGALLSESDAAWAKIALATG